ncbi:unnamed protein product [Auanema sp. JU1783]|nr:unnamed protein product [Auanema sp. JU1783]
MVMIETFIGMAKYLMPRYDDDWSDRLHYMFTPNILLAFSVLISFKQFGGRPIECMFPNKFPGSWEQYAENYCWSQDTYFVEKQQHVELLETENRYSRERQLSYYQWVPFFLLLQAAFFRAPSIFWKYFCNTTGIRIHEVVERARDSANVEEDVKEKNVNVLVRHMKNALRFQNRIERNGVVVHRTFRFLNFQYSSSFISTVYLITKVFYLVNVVFQLWLMNTFLKTNSNEWYGYGVVKSLINGTNWETSGYFPRAAVCDFEVRQVANIQKYSVQCVLVINIFNEKIFVLLWFWYSMIFVCALITFVQWFAVLVLPCFPRWFINQHLQLSALENFNPNSHRDALNVKRFVTKYLRRDGVFVLRMVSSHAGIIFGSDLVLALWRYYDDQEQRKSLGLSDLSPLTDQDSLRKRKTSRLSFMCEGDSDFGTTLVPLSPEEEKKSLSERSERNHQPNRDFDD